MISMITNLSVTFTFETRSLWNVARHIWLMFLFTRLQFPFQVVANERQSLVTCNDQNSWQTCQETRWGIIHQHISLTGHWAILLGHSIRELKSQRRLTVLFWISAWVICWVSNIRAEAGEVTAGQHYTSRNTHWSILSILFCNKVLLSPALN